MNAVPSPQSGSGKWMALTAALLGWMFDGFEMGMFSMIGRPAIKELMADTIKDLAPAAQNGTIGLWFGVITAGFLVGAATGGVLFGWLGDCIGRVRAMTLSVFTYAVFTGLCGFANETWQICVLRFIAALGMGGEWSLGVALVMEIWPNRTRAFMAGLIGAAGNVGYLLVAFASLGLGQVAGPLRDLAQFLNLPESRLLDQTGNPSWRLMMILGAIPALLTFFIQLFVPESERWKAEESKGGTAGWAARDLFGVLLGVLGPVLIIYLWAWEGPAVFPNSLPVRLVGTMLGLLVALAGYTYPVIQYLHRQRGLSTGDRLQGPILQRMLLGACLSGVALLGTWGSTQWAPSWAHQLTENTPEAQEHPKEHTQIWLAVGAIVGTLGSAMLGDLIGRRPAFFLQCGLALASVYLLFLANTSYGFEFLVATFVAGLCTASFYGWLPLYLPELFPTVVRATGQGFSFNFGRILAAVGVLQTGNLMRLFEKDWHVGPLTLPHGYPLACSVMSLIYLVGMVIIWLAPETKGKPLPE